MDQHPPKKSVLVVDDEHDIVELIRYNLTKEGYAVTTAHSGQEALSAVKPAMSLVILDVMMPQLDGFETCKRLKSDPGTAHIPVMFLTASISEVDEVLGLELGADDYIQKPISPRKLVARVKAVIRRADAEPGQEEQSIIRVDQLEIHKENYTVKMGKREIFFPKKEFEILALLAGNRGKVFTREMLLNTVWGSDVVVVDRTVDVHIRKIREKLGDDGTSIETVKGVGYRYKE